MTIVVKTVGSSDEHCPSGAYGVAAAVFDPQTLASIGRKHYGVSYSVRKNNQEEESYGEEGSGGGAAHRDVRSTGGRKRRRRARNKRRSRVSFIEGWAHALLVVLLLMHGSQPSVLCGTRQRDMEITYTRETEFTHLVHFSLAFVNFD